MKFFATSVIFDFNKSQCIDWTVREKEREKKILRRKIYKI